MKNLYLWILALLSIAAFKLDAQELPHIVVYLADDLSYNDVGVNGAKVVNTPMLDKFGNNGLIFSNAFIASPACAPSRAALLTGLMPTRNGAEANHTYPKEGTPVLISSLKKAGYKVYAFGKVAHGAMNEHADFDYYNSQKVNLFKNVKAVFDTMKVTSPICLLVGDRRPHVKWTDENIYGVEEVDLPGYFIDTKETREHRGRYYTDVTGLDQEFGRVMKYAQEKLGNNMVRMFTSDHGAQWPFAKWNLYDAGIHVPLMVQWDEEIKAGATAEAMVSWVDIFPTLLNIAQLEQPKDLDGKSFLNVLKNPSERFRKEIFTTHTGDADMNIYPIRSIRTEKYKYIVNLLPNCYHTNHSDLLRKDGAGAYWDSWYNAALTDSKAKTIIAKYYVRPAEEFYDLETDPDEQVNLIDCPESQSIIAKMKKQLDDWMVNQGDSRKPHRDPYPISEPIPNMEKK